MTWSKKKSVPFSYGSYEKTARKNGYKAAVIYNNYHKHFYFTLFKDGCTYNSLWDNEEFKTEEDCMKVCEGWINEQRRRGNG